MQAATLAAHHLPKGAFTLQFGQITGQLVGGPYHGAPRTGYYRVKLAEEIDAACEVDLPIRDFSTPQPLPTLGALANVLEAMSDGTPVFVGCMGGIGRTGLFLSLLTKLAQEYEDHSGIASGVGHYEDAVEAVRALYYSHAVETSTQRRFIEDFDLTPLLRHLDRLQPVPAGPNRPATLWTRFRDRIVATIARLRAA